MSIPKIFMQTSRQKPEKYIIDMIQESSPNWEYQHYTDDEIILFFSENHIEEFPNVIAKFYSLSYGEHRADLFRYYFLYVKGGVYMDMDAMIQDNIENIVKDADFFTVESSYFPNTVFQGFLGAIPKHPLIYKALKDIYITPLENLIKEFHLLCKNLYTFIIDYETNDKNKESRIILFKEVYGNEMEAFVNNKENKTILIHYHIKKIIPYQL
jgi:mannosyltransferase OCH1-like enzyme